MSNAIGLSSHIWNNNLKCIILLAFYPVLIIGIFWLIAYVFGTSIPTPTGQMPSSDRLIAIANQITYDFWPTILTGVAIWFMISWFFHTNMIRKLAHSHPVSRPDEPELYNLLENLCISQGMKMPHLEIIETNALNAFASGITDKTFAVTVTRGLMERLNRDELEAVLAHELTHIQNRDVRLLIVCIIFTGFFGFLAQMAWSMVRYKLFFGSRNRNQSHPAALLLLVGLVVILWLGYFATLLMRFALSRRREYMADAGAIAMTKNPTAMMSALQRISGNDHIPETTDDIAMMCIENRKPFMGMFATHPPIDARIQAISAVTNTPIPETTPQRPSRNKNPWI